MKARKSCVLYLIRSYSGMILVDATGTITFANRRMAEMFGYDMEEFIGTSYPEYMHETQY